MAGSMFSIVLYLLKYFFFSVIGNEPMCAQQMSCDVNDPMKDPEAGNCVKLTQFLASKGKIFKGIVLSPSLVMVRPLCLSSLF